MLAVGVGGTGGGGLAGAGVGRLGGVVETMTRVERVMDGALGAEPLLGGGRCA